MNVVRKEIGSEFWNAPTIENENRVFSKSVQWFLSGRSALKSIINDLKHLHTVALPSWCCHTMIRPFLDAGFEVKFYSVYWNVGLKQDIHFECDVLFLIDYFGYSVTNPDISGYGGIVIRDVTHSIYSTSYTDADYYFGSLRKWCGVWTGGYAWAKDGHHLIMEQNDDFGYTILREKAMQLKNSYLHGWGVTDKEYLRVFNEAEEILEKAGISPAAERDVMLAKKIDVGFIRERRRANAKVLREAFPDWLIFREMNDADCPMFVPIFVPDGRRDELRNFLIKNDIYCPIHWPVSDYHKLDEKEQFLYDNELSLVCDQRYAEDDMRRMVQAIEIFMGE